MGLLCILFWRSFVFYFGMMLKIDVLLFLWLISDHSWDTLFPEDLGAPEWHMFIIYPVPKE